ncbi:MAG: hypothetical protein ACYDGY_11160, partial [Acidimicrobiales bacterium]
MEQRKKNGLLGSLIVGTSIVTAVLVGWIGPAASGVPLRHVLSESATVASMPAPRAAVDPGGGIYHFGDAASVASPLPVSAVPAPIVSITATPDGNGYYLVGANGSIYTFGNAVYRGSLGAYTDGQVPAPIVGMAVTPDGNGYYLVGANGSI